MTIKVSGCGPSFMYSYIVKVQGLKSSVINCTMVNCNIMLLVHQYVVCCLFLPCRSTLIVFIYTYKSTYVLPCSPVWVMQLFCHPKCRVYILYGALILFIVVSGQKWVVVLLFVGSYWQLLSDICTLCHNHKPHLEYNFLLSLHSNMETTSVAEPVMVYI